MQNCLICNNNGSLITLFNLNNIANFNYCHSCFHCQTDHINSYDNKHLIKKSHLTNNNIDLCLSNILQNIRLQEQDNVLFVTEQLFAIPDYDQILFGNFLDLNTDTYKKYKSIIFYKTFDKTRDIKLFLQHSKTILETTAGNQIIIVTSTEDVITKRKYNNINPNTVSYFCTNSMKTLCEQFDLTIMKIDKNEDYSIYTIGYKINDEIGCTNDVIKYLYLDIENDLYDDKTYILFNIYGLYLKSNVKKKLAKLNIRRMENLETYGPHLIIGWSGNNQRTSEHSINFINFCELTSEYIDYFLSFESNSNTTIGMTDIYIQNYWELFGSNPEKHIVNTHIEGSCVTILNFTNSRIEDTIYRSFTNLYGSDINIIEICSNENI